MFIVVIAFSGVNIALLRPAFQSSTKYENIDSGHAYRAVDGNTITWKTNDGSCAFTKKEVNPWWAVDLRRVYFVTTVTILNIGQGHCKSYLSKHKLYYATLLTQPQCSQPTAVIK